MNPLWQQIEEWDGTGNPPGIATIKAQPEWQSLPPAERVQTLNAAQRAAANRIRTDDPAGYGTTIRMVEDDFNSARREELKAGLSEDLASGALTDEQIRAYLKGGTEALDGEAARYVEQRYGRDADTAGPWVTHKLDIAGENGKSVGYAYVRYSPDTVGNVDKGRDRAEVSWTVNVPKSRQVGGQGYVKTFTGINTGDAPDLNEQISGTEDIALLPLLQTARQEKVRRDYIAEALRSGAETGITTNAGAVPPDAEQQHLFSILGMEPVQQTAALAQMGTNTLLRSRPEIADRIGQGFIAGFPQEAAKGFLGLGAAAIQGPQALFGNRHALEQWRADSADINAIEGQSALGFQGGTWNSVLQSISQEAIPMLFSAGSSAAGAALRRAATSKWGSSFLARMARMELDASSRQMARSTTAEGLKKLAAAELTGESATGPVRQWLTESMGRGRLGKWVGTSQIKGKLAQQLADRVSNAWAFLPSSMRTGLQNMATTLDAAEAARAAGNEAKAKELEDNAILNGWAGTLTETLSENMWLNEMMVTRAGRPLSRVATDVLARRLKPGTMQALTQRAATALRTMVKAGAEEGTEEIVAGVANRAWMNAFAGQNQDLLQDVPTEFLAGALLGAVMGGAKSLAQDGKPAVLNELIQRGLQGDPAALATAMQEIRARAAERAAAGPQSAPESAGSDNGAAGAVTRLPGIVARSGQEPVPATAAPGTVENAPVPDNAETVDEQLRLARAKDSSRTAVLFTPGTELPGKRPRGLEQVTTPHGTVWFNPDKTTRETIAEAGRGDVFDASVLGLSGQPAGAGQAVVTASTPAAANVQAEVVDSAAAIPAAAQAAAAAAPGARVEVKTPEQVTAERTNSTAGNSAAAAPDAVTTTTTPTQTPNGQEIQGQRQETLLNTPLQPDARQAVDQNGKTAISSTGPGSPSQAHPGQTPLAGSRSEAGQPGSGAGVASASPGPAAQEAVEVKPKGKSFFRIPDNPTGAYDVVDFLLENKVRRFPRLERDRLGDKKPRGGEHDALVRLHTEMPAYYAAISRESGTPIDDLAQQAWENHLISEPSPDALIDAFRDAVKSRKKLAAEQKAAEGHSRVAEQAARREDRQQKAAWRKATKDGATEITSRSMEVGAVIEVEGITLRLVQKSDTEAWWEDGERFGTQRVPLDEVIGVEYVEDATDTAAQTAVDERPGDPDAERVPFSKPLDPFRGDFFAGTEDDIFNLVAEFPEERAAREARELKDQQARDKKQAEAERLKAAKQQGMLFSRGSQTTRPKASHAAGAITILSKRAPELLRGLRVVQSVDELNPQEFHPDDWQHIQEGAEAFFHPGRRESVIIASRITVRKGETPIQAVARVILHEQLGHHGLKLAREGSPEFNRAWQELVRSIPGEELLSVLQTYPELASNEDLLAQEWFAREAEKRVKNMTAGPLRRAWEAFKAWVQKIWSGFAAGIPLQQRVTEALMASRQALRTAVPGPAGVKARLAAGIPVNLGSAVIVPPRGSGVQQKLTAYHGTPHTVDKFSTAKVGTGEGNQVYGWGLYFAENRDVARKYHAGLSERDLLAKVREAYDEFSSLEESEAILNKSDLSPEQRALIEALQQEDWWGFEKPHEAVRAALREPQNYEQGPATQAAIDALGGVYTVKIDVEPEQLLNWDQPLDLQSELVQKQLGYDWLDINATSGRDFYNKLAEDRGQAAASQYLLQMGIQGVAYLDGKSRLAGDGTRNFVIFDDARIHITERNGRELQFSKGPFEARDWQAVPFVPDFIRRKLGAHAVAAFQVQAQTTRAVLTGSPLPRDFVRIVSQTQDEIRGIQSHAAALGGDLQAAMKAYAKRTRTPLLQVNAAVNDALTDPAALAAMADPVLKERTRAVRNFIDVLSHEVAATTGGTLGAAILANSGSYMRRLYAVFDPAANWNKDSLRAAAAAGKMLAGRDARKILNDARAYLTAQHPGQTPAGIEAIITDLLDRKQWMQDATGLPRAEGGRVSREVSSFMRRKDMPPEIRALLGEEINPIKRLAATVGIQAQLVARYDQQRTLRDLGLRMGIFSETRDGTYNEPVGGEDAGGNMRWNGFAITDPATGEVRPIYTTSEMLQALNNAAAVEGQNLGSILINTFKWLGGEAKMNKVALNPDSWSVNVLGNVLGLMQSGDIFSLAGWRNVMEAVKIHRASGANSGEAINAVAEALREQRRQTLAALVASGVAGASYELRDLEAQLDNSMLAMIESGSTGNRVTGAVRGAAIGQAVGRAIGGTSGRIAGAGAGGIVGTVMGGSAITAVQRRIASAVLGAPDNVGKIAVYLGNYQSLRASGMAHDAAHQLAAEKTRNTMPDYSRLPAFLRESSKLGLTGSFIAFQWEVYRNYYWTLRYAAQELRSGKAPLVMRGMRRLLGAGTVTALGSGVLGMIAGALHGAVDRDKDEAYRRSLGAPWERFAALAYTRLDRDGASFYNTSYLVPQASLFEIGRAALEGKDFGDGLVNALTAARRQFADGSVHGDPVLEAITNSRFAGGNVTNEEGWRAVLARLDHVLRVLEPGAANKAERLRFAITGEEKRGRTFSVSEEMLRMVGVRQGAYQHEERMLRRMRAIRERYQDARDQARRVWKDEPKDRPAAIERANERIAAAEQDWQQFRADMRTLGIPDARLEQIRRNASLGSEFYRLKPGKDGPESVR